MVSVLEGRPNAGLEGAAKDTGPLFLAVVEGTARGEKLKAEALAAADRTAAQAAE